MTASAPEAKALQMSPPVVMPPSVMIGTYGRSACSRSRARPRAVGGGGHLRDAEPSTSRLVHAAPGPTPISSASTPAVHQLEARLVGDDVADDERDRQCFLAGGCRPGVYSVAMCRAVVTVDCTTKKSAPASSAILAKRSARCGIEETRTGPPPFLISLIRLWISSSLMGSR